MKTYYTAPLIIKSRSESKDLERYIKQWNAEAFEAMQKHFGDDMMRQLCKQGNFASIEFFFCGRLKRSLGQATTRNNCRTMGIIKMHKKFFVEHQNKLDVMRNTYIHELAHVIINRIYGKTQQHNDNWRKLFMIMGGNGETTHKENVARYSRPYVYTCQCDKPFHLSAAQHRKNTQWIKRHGESRYSCHQCNAKIKFNAVL
jgi:predicted SprT family Zn-dependent metalloprotease